MKQKPSKSNKWAHFFSFSLFLPNLRQNALALKMEMIFALDLKQRIGIVDAIFGGCMGCHFSMEFPLIWRKIMQSTFQHIKQLKPQDIKPLDARFIANLNKNKKWTCSSKKNKKCWRFKSCRKFARRISALFQNVRAAVCGPKFSHNPTRLWFINETIMIVSYWIYG